ILFVTSPRVRRLCRLLEDTGVRRAIPMTILRVKSVEHSIRDAEAPEFRLRRVLSAWDLLGIGIGAIIGTGIFVLTGVAAATDAGPAISISFVLSGIACGLAALCYAEFASVVPV